MNCIVLHVWYACRPGGAEGFIRALKDGGVQETVRAEDGCLRYDYHLSREAADTVVLLEQWRDAESLARHLAQPHMEDVARIKADFVLETRVERFE